MIIKNNDPYTQPSFSKTNRALRLTWNIFYFFLFKYTPNFMHSWRALILKIFGAKIGKNVHVYPRVRIWAPWNLIIEDRVGIANGVTIYSMNKIIIRKNAVISQGSHLCTGSHDINSENFQLITKKIDIGAYSWICAESFIGPGVTIPEGCVISARSVIMKSPEDSWCVFSGNPGKKIKSRTQSIKENHV